VLQAVQCCKVSSLLVNYLHGLPSFNRPVWCPTLSTYVSYHS
jgi:hypothetical protein